LIKTICSRAVLSSLILAQSYIPAQHTFTGNPCSISPVVIRGSNQGLNDTGLASLNIPLPAGSAVGDLTIGFQSNWRCWTSPAGWTVVWNSGGCPQTWSGSAFTHILDSSDITAGQVVIPDVVYAGSYSFQVGTIVVLVGPAGGVREAEGAWSAGSSLTQNFNTTSAVVSGDVGIYWASSRFGSGTPIAPVITPPGCPLAPLQTILTQTPPDPEGTATTAADSRLGNGIQTVTINYPSGAGGAANSVIVVVEQ
jgi:hypothetical protein